MSYGRLKMGGGGCNLVSVPITPAHKQTSVNLCGESIKKQKMSIKKHLGDQGDSR